MLEEILSKSKQHNPTFIACILTIILTNIEHLSIDISLVSQVAKKSDQTQLGNYYYYFTRTMCFMVRITVLSYSGIRIIEEKLLLSKEQSEPRRKRARVSQDSSEICDEQLHDWMSLARYMILRVIVVLAKHNCSLICRWLKLKTK